MRETLRHALDDALERIGQIAGVAGTTLRVAFLHGADRVEPRYTRSVGEAAVSTQAAMRM